MTTDTVYDVPEAAKRLGVSERTMRRLAREGRIPSRKVGRSWRFSADALREWLTGSDGSEGPPE